MTGCGESTPTANSAAPPADCAAAIDDARAIARTMSTVLDAASDYPKLVPRAALAGSTSDATELDAIARRMKTLNRRLERANDRVTGQIEAFNAHAAGCE